MDRLKENGYWLQAGIDFAGQGSVEFQTIQQTKIEEPAQVSSSEPLKRTSSKEETEMRSIIDSQA